MKKIDRKKIIILVILVVILGLTVGYAAFSSSANISSSLKVSPNASTFSVIFSNTTKANNETTVKPDNSDLGENAIIDNDGSDGPSITNLQANFTKPGEEVTYTFYAINTGEYDAFLTNAIFGTDKYCKVGSGTDETLANNACNSISIAMTINDEEIDNNTIFSNHLLSKNNGYEEIKITITYDSNGARADGPFSVTFGDITLIYKSIDSSSDDTAYNGTINLENSLYNKVRSAAVLDNIASEYVTSDTGIDFGSFSSDTNGKGVYELSSTVNNTYPVYYYRGDVTNNNVLFANLCWKIVRTTETGGVKLIYNGSPTSDGQCTNTTEETTMIGESEFNENYDAAIYVGYTYEENSITKNSNVKDVIDNWYEKNMTDFTNYLEDTIWCNDRKEVVIEEEDFESEGVIIYASLVRLYSNNQPSLVCEQVSDRYTVNKINGNGKLTYPVALLTVDEVMYAGGFDKRLFVDEFYEVSVVNYYLNNNNACWLLSPIFFDDELAYVSIVREPGFPDVDSVSYFNGVRPSVSLKPGTTVSEGNGSSSKPYVIG